MSSRLIDTMQFVQGFAPVNMASAANTGDVVSFKLYKRIGVLFIGAVGAAAQDPTLTIEQGTSVAFSTNKALNFTSIFVKQASALTAVGEFTEVTQSAANTYTSATAGETQQMWYVEFQDSDLDIDGGYDCLRASIGDTGSTSKLGTLQYILGEPRYAKQPMPSAIAD